MNQPLHPYTELNKKRALIVLGIATSFVLAFVLDLSTGSSKMTLSELWQALWAGPGGSIIVWDIRLPMTLTAVFVGAALGIAGLQLQTITNNPLASPYTFGVTASASFGAALSITVGFAIMGQLWLGTATFAGMFALLAACGIFYMGKWRGMSTTTIVLTGIVINFFFTALQQLLQYRASAEVAQVISSWTFGNLERATWTSVSVNAVLVLICLLILLRLSWRLTALSTGEEKAASLGINVGKLRFAVFALSALLTAGAVAFIGTVAFVGLVAPHCARLLLGDDQRYLLPGTILFGGMLMLLASILSKWLSVGSMLPVGIITSIVGVPFLFILLVRNKRA